MHGDIVGDCAPGIPVIEPVEIFETRGGDLLDALAHLDLWNEGPVLLDRNQLIDPPKHRIGFAGNQVFAYAKQVKLRTLNQKVPDQIFVERVGCHDLAVWIPCII